VRRVYSSIIVLLMLLPMLFPTLAISATPINPEAKRVENMLNVAYKSRNRVEALVNNVKANQTLMNLISVAGLMDAFNGNLTLLKNGENLLKTANETYSAGDYIMALNYTFQALDIFRDVFRNIHVIVGKAGGYLERESVIVAEGLIVAANRTLERIKSIRELGNIPSEADEKLSEAEALLNTAELRSLLTKGNVSEVAHRIADAEKLVADALKIIKSKAEEKCAERMDKFIAKVNETFDKIIEKARSLGVNASEVLKMFGFKNLSEIQEMKNNLIGKVRSYIKFGNITQAIKEMDKAMEKIRNMNMEMERVRYIAQYHFNAKLEVKVEKSVKKPFIILDITITNTGNATLIFPNSAFGLTIERSVDGSWKPVYTPISAQVLMMLRPGESRHIVLRVELPAGTYRVAVHAMCEKIFTPVTAYAEFTIP
jgi:tetratricopeptide (TPR) repeat protein